MKYLVLPKDRIQELVDLNKSSPYRKLSLAKKDDEGNVLISDSYLSLDYWKDFHEILSTLEKVDK